MSGAPRGRLRFRLLLLLGGILLALILAELCVRILWSRFEIPDDVVTDYERAFGPKDFGRRGFFPIPGTVFSSRYDGDPYGTLPEGDAVTYRLNEWGFRGRAFEQGRAHGGPVVAVVGDSFVFGEGVEAGDRLTEVCEKDLAPKAGRGARVYNLGVSGYCSEDEADVAREFFPVVKPDVVVVGYCLNDPVHLLDEAYREQFAFDLVMRRDGHLREEGEGESPLYLVRLIERYFESRRLTERTIRWYRGLYEGDECAWTRSRNKLLVIQDVAREHGAETVLLIMPIFFRVGDDYPFTGIHEQIAEWCEAHGIAVLDALSLFEGRKTEDLVVHPKDHHPNARAHRLMGEALAEFLKERLPEDR